MKCWASAFLLLVFKITNAQSLPALTTSVCSYYGEGPRPSAIRLERSKEAESIIASIIKVIGLKPRFEIFAADIPNAAAVIHNGKRFVLYNPGFISQLNKSTGSNWASVSILAHEIGHHLNGHTLEEGGSRPDLELEADEFSGFVLRKLGASLEQAQGAMRIAADVKASHTHPGREQRLQSIARGWHNAGGDDKSGSEPIAVEKPVIAKKLEKPEQPIADKFILFDAKFSADPEGIYHVTVRHNLVKVHNGNLYVIGRLGESNKSKYSYMLYDELFNYLYVDSSGNIYNLDDKRVGKIVKHQS